MKKTIIIVIASTLGFSQNEAVAESIKFCLQSQGDYVDNNFALSDGTTEDYWRGDSDKEIRGGERDRAT